MDILLTHGYFIAEDAHEQQIMKPYPPLGLLYISSHLKATGFDVHVFDTTFSTLVEFQTFVERERPGLVGIYCNLMTKFNVLAMLQICKAVNATVILGGPEPASYAGEYLSRGADIIAVGEGERTLEALIPHLAKKGMTGLAEIRGILFRDDNGGLQRTPAREQIKPLSDQPWPDRESIDLERYLTTWETHHGVRSISLVTSRGCPYTCTWCSHSVFGHTHRRRTPEDVVAEVAWLKERYRPTQLWYADDVFTIQPRWTLKYATLLKEKDIRIPFECISRADRLNDAVCDALAEMGCYRLWIGSESGSQRILDAMQRKADVEDVQRKSRMLQERGIEVGMFIMLGYEGEKIVDLQATVDHLKRSNPDVFLTTVSYPIKGTQYYSAVENRVVAHLDWEARSDRDLQVTGRYSRRFYEHATRWMVNEVNLHRARTHGSASAGQRLKMQLNAWRGRLGMRMTQHQKEDGMVRNGSGRGWGTKERATTGW